MEKWIDIPIINKSNNPLPEYPSPFFSGMEVPAFTDQLISIKPGVRRLINTGFFVNIPPGYEIQIRPSATWSLREGLTVLNAPDTINSNNHKEITILIINHGRYAVEIKNDDHIAQIVLQRVPRILWKEVENFDTTT